MANYAHSSKLRRIEPSKQIKRRKSDKWSDNKGKIKKQKAKSIKHIEKNIKKTVLQLKTKYFISYNMGYITSKCSKKSSSRPFFLHNI